MHTAIVCTQTWSAKPARSWPNCNKPERSVKIDFVCGQVAQLVERSPEKAGVGGSIPSLATTKSITYQPARRRFHSISFQNNGARRFASSENCRCASVGCSRFRLSSDEAEGRECERPYSMKTILR